MRSINMEKLNSVLVVASILVLASSIQWQFFQVNAQGNNAVAQRQPKLKVNENQAPSKCGSIEQIAKRIETCARTVVDILEGTVKKWPTGPNDMVDFCKEMEKAERCIRDVGRQCVVGLQRTIVSTFANAWTRTRKRECVPKNHINTYKAVNCVEKNQESVYTVMHNVTDHMRVITDQMTDLDRKTTTVCCMLGDVEVAINQNLGPKCAQETKVIVRLYRSILEDVINLMCRAPMCKDLFKGYVVRKSNQYDGLVSLVLQILFSIT